MPVFTPSTKGDLTVNGGAKMTGTGVTIIFTSSTGANYPTASINGGAVISLTPPTTGPLTGVVMFGDRDMPVGALLLVILHVWHARAPAVKAGKRGYDA